MSEAPNSLPSSTTTEEEISEALTQIEINAPPELSITNVAKSAEEAPGPSRSAKYQIGPGDSDDPDEEEHDYDPEEDDDDTLSSEAVVDDIELILMPEETEDMAESPKLVRVRELRFGDYEEEDDDDCNFRKMDISERSGALGFSDEEDELEEEEEGAVGYSTIPITFSEFSTRPTEGGEEEEPSFASSTTSGRIRGRTASSGVQTDITALNNPTQPFILDPRGAKKDLGKAYGGKKLNWKSELTLLSSKTKIGRGLSGGGMGGRAGDERDEYSAHRGVTKFTSQDNVLNASSQFLKPSTLYRTRNLSRNLNQLGSSETSFVLPGMSESRSAQPSPRYPKDWDPGHPASSRGGTTESTFKRPLSSFSAAKSFRSSLPDLNTMSIGGTGFYQDNTKRRRQSCTHVKPARQAGARHRKSSRRKSSSDEETSSLIDESERCLRSSIDLLLTDELPTPGFDYPYHGSRSSRRYSSQPILSDEAYFSREPRDRVLGSPFLPRRMADMRCSKWAKVILPNGQVSVVSVMEMDEIRDRLTVQSDTGCVVTIPFRKVVFAWRSRR